MRWRQTIVRWLSSFTLLCFTAGIILAYPPALAAPPRQFSQVTDIVEVSPPKTIQKLRAKIDRYQPQVKILSPAADQIIKDDSITVRFEVKDLPIFKDGKLGLGPHLNVLLDNQPAQEVYDLSQPLVFQDLEPGTHTIRVVATRPWSESFKNPGAFAQTTFHIFTQTEDNRPLPNRPLLTYGQPQGVFGSDTVLIDFFLSNLPATTSTSANWQVQVSVNGSQFQVDAWQPLYVQGLKPGKNWVQMQLTDRQGHKIENTFNDTIRIVELQERGGDTLSRLIRGDLSALDAGGIVDANYKRPQPPVKPTQPSPVTTPSPAPVKSQKIETPKSKLAPTPDTQQPSPASTLKPKASESPSTSAPAKTASPPKPAEIKPDSIKQQTKQPVKPQMPSQKEQKSIPAQPKDSASSPAQTSVSSPVKQEPIQTLDKTEGTEAQQPQPAEVKSPKSDVKVEERPPIILQKEQPKTTGEPKAIEKIPPKVIEKSPLPRQEPPSQSIEKAPVPRLDTSKPSPTSTGVDDKAQAPTPPIPTREKSPALPDSTKKSKGTKRDDKPTLKSAFTKFWQQVRPSQATVKSSQPASTAGEKVPTPTQEAGPKPTPNLSTSPTQKTTTSPIQVEPKPAPTKATTPTVPSSQQPIKSQKSASSTPSSLQSRTTKQSKSSPSVPKAAESGQKSIVQDAPEKTQPPTSTPAKTPEKSTPSIFSSLRDRWKQQQNKAAPPLDQPMVSPKTMTSPSAGNPTVTKEKPPIPDQTTTPQTSSPAASARSNPERKEVAQPTAEPKFKSKPAESALSTLRKRWQQQKQLMAPATKTTPNPVVKSSPAKATEITGPMKTVPRQDQVPASTQPPAPKADQEKPATQPNPKTIQKPTVTKSTTEPTRNTKLGETKSSEPLEPAKPEQTNSIFSSLRDRWQQQKQLMVPSPQEKAVLEPTPSPKPSSSTVTPPQAVSPSQPKAPSPTVMPPQRTSPSQPNSASQREQKTDGPPSPDQGQKQVQQSDPVTFDPGSYYRRFLSRQANDADPKRETVSPSSP